MLTKLFLDQTTITLLKPRKWRALAFWPNCFDATQHLSEWRRIHPLESLHISLRERRNLQRDWGKETPLLRIIELPSSKNSLQVSEILIVFKLVHQRSIKGDFSIYYWYVCSIWALFFRCTSLFKFIFMYSLFPLFTMFCLFKSIY